LPSKLKMIAGDVPATSEAVSVFIDIIGRPLTPVPFADAASRGYRTGFPSRVSQKWLPVLG
jgi:hypothetical protein